MTAGRTPTPFVPQDKPVIDSEQVGREMNAAFGQVAVLHENTTALAKTLGYEGSLAPESLEEGIRESLARVNYEVFTMGARLLLLKEQCAHGEFMERCAHLDLDRQAASRLMLIAHKFSNVGTSRHLAALGKSKLFELALLDDDEAAAFAEGQTVRGITYDDAARMSFRALREKLREQDEQIKAKDRVAADNQGRIQKLQEQLATKKPEDRPTPAFIADAALRDLDNEAQHIAGLIAASLRSYIVKVNDPDLAVGDVLRRQAIIGACGRVLAAARQVAQDFDVPVTGAEAADGCGEMDAEWAATLRDLAAAEGDGDVAQD
ncbi:MAG TPA: hypothetical protein PLU47_00900 [Azonexus sp.]|nr:hypothetical protein [Azonexus sp.]